MTEQQRNDVTERRDGFELRRYGVALAAMALRRLPQPGHRGSCAAEPRARGRSGPGWSGVILSRSR